MKSNQRFALLFYILVGLLTVVIGQITPPAWIVRVTSRNAPCTGTHGDNGTCLEHSDCVQRGGQTVGSCGFGHMVCCLASVTCGGVIKENGTIFVNSKYPESEETIDTCEVSIEKKDNVCQLRLDMEEFELGQPDDRGLCSQDSFIVWKTVGGRLPVLCGDNKGQHMYVDMGRKTSNPVVLSVVKTGLDTPGRWKIRVTMIRCRSSEMATPGCLQYHDGTEGLIKSFNYGPSLPGKVRYISNLRYTVCIRMAERFCAIRWQPEDEDAFSWGWPYHGGATGDYCLTDDFVGIDNGSKTGRGPGADRFCGGQLAEDNVITSARKPFQLRVWSNGDATKNANNSQSGFSLRYVQLPCILDSALR